MRCVSTARAIATRAHSEQKRSDGKPYITHPRAVASLVAHEGRGYECVAWLHDVVEDTDFTISGIIEEGFDQDIVDAIIALTKVEGEPYSSYLLRACCDTIATSVKIADLTHNLSDHPRNTRRDKYEASKMFLELSKIYENKQ